MRGYLLLAMLHVLASPPVTKNLIFRISNSLLEKKLYKKRTKNSPKKKSCFIFLSGVRYHAEEVCKSSLGTLFDMVYKFYCMVISIGGTGRQYYWGRVVHSTYYMTS